MNINDLKNELNNEKQSTENGALGYKATGKALLDMNFSTTSLRKMNEQDIYNKFLKAYFEDKLLAIKWLFYLRDARGGIGERRSFRAIISYLAYDQPLLVKELISIIPEYGRYDDLWCLLDTELKDEVVKFCYMQLMRDIKNCNEGKPISLLAKWLPSTYSKKDKYPRYAKVLSSGFNLIQKDYSKVLSKLRNYSNVVECKMSRNKWDEIDYPSIPSKANVLYKNAFMRHDGERRKEYLESLSKGETKINAGVLFPHDIVHKYTENGFYSLRTKDYDETLEQLWKSLPNYCVNGQQTIVVRDDSGSMTVEVDNKSSTVALEVATALAIYFSERLHGEFKDKYISFSRNPKFIDMSNCDNLREKLDLSYSHSEVSNTDIYKTFKLILDTAVNNRYEQKDMPDNVLILSDMEFDWATTSRENETLFETIKREYAECGYKMPKIIFWNLCSRTNTIPLKENENGVVLLSSFSPVVVKMALSNKLDPYECLVEQLNSARYDLVEEAYKKVKH